MVLHQHNNVVGGLFLGSTVCQIPLYAVEHFNAELRGTLVELGKSLHSSVVRNCQSVMSHRLCQSQDVLRIYHCIKGTELGVQVKLNPLCRSSVYPLFGLCFVYCVGIDYKPAGVCIVLHPALQKHPTALLDELGKDCILVQENLHRVGAGIVRYIECQESPPGFKLPSLQAADPTVNSDAGQLLADFTELNRSSSDRAFKDAPPRSAATTALFCSVGPASAVLSGIGHDLWLYGLRLISRIV